MLNPATVDKARTSTPKIDVINGLRGFAALAVVYHHFFDGLTVATSQAVTVGALKFFPYAFANCGWMGVMLFFLLSGFVLYLPYVQGKRDMVTPEDRNEFWRRRWRRLLPLYYVCAGVCILLVTYDGGIIKKLMWTALMGTLTFPLSPRTYSPAPNWVLWSLGVEVLFSVVFPWVILWAKNWRISRLLIASLIFSLVMRFIALPLGFADTDSPYHHWIASNLPGSFDAFIWGMVIADLYMKWRDDASHWIHRAAGWLALLGLVVVYVGCVLCVNAKTELLPDIYKPLLSPVYMSGMFLLTLGVLFSRSFITHLICSNWLIQLSGMMCFSLYVWHGVAIVPLVGDDRSLLAFAGYLVIVYLVSFVTYRYIEFGYERDLSKILPPKSAWLPWKDN